MYRSKKAKVKVIASKTRLKFYILTKVLCCKMTSVSAQQCKHKTKPTTCTKSYIYFEIFSKITIQFFESSG